MDREELEDNQKYEQLELFPCNNCGRTFQSKSLQKHEEVCTKVATKQRKVFDSRKQRVDGTELAQFNKSNSIHKPEKVIKQETSPNNTHPRISKATDHKWQENQTDLAKTIKSARKELGAMIASPTPNKRSLTDCATHEQCPFCDRKFGLKAFDRHVEWCKEHHVRVQKSPANVLLAKGRLDARINYKVPPVTSAVRRKVVKEKYRGTPSNNKHQQKQQQQTSPVRPATRSISLQDSTLKNQTVELEPKKCISLEKMMKKTSWKNNKQTLGPLRINSPKETAGYECITVSKVPLVATKMVTWKEISKSSTNILIKTSQSEKNMNNTAESSSSVIELRTLNKSEPLIYLEESKKSDKNHDLLESIQVNSTEKNVNIEIPLNRNESEIDEIKFIENEGSEIYDQNIYIENVCDEIDEPTNKSSENLEVMCEKTEKIENSPNILKSNIQPRNDDYLCDYDVPPKKRLKLNSTTSVCCKIPRKKKLKIKKSLKYGLESNPKCNLNFSIDIPELEDPDSKTSVFKKRTGKKSVPESPKIKRDINNVYKQYVNDFGINETEYDPFESAKYQLAQLLDANDIKPAVPRSSKSLSADILRTNQIPLLHKKNRKNISKSAEVTLNSDNKDDFEAIERLLNSHQSDDAEIVNLCINGSLKENVNNKICGGKSNDDLSIDSNLINENDNLEIPKHLTDDRISTASSTSSTDSTVLNNEENEIKNNRITSCLDDSNSLQDILCKNAHDLIDEPESGDNSEKNLFSIDDEIYAEYKVFEEIYLGKNRQSSSTRKQKQKNCALSLGISIGGGQEDVAQCNDSAYGSLNTRSPKEKFQEDAAEKSPRSSNLELSYPTTPNITTTTLTTTATSITYSTSAAMHLPKFCHECGTKYPIVTAKFCVECGVKRLML